MHRLDPVAGIYADGGTGVKVTLARPRRDRQCRTLDTAHAVPSPWGGGAGLVFQRPGGTAENGLYVAHRGLAVAIKRGLRLLGELVCAMSPWTSSSPSMPTSFKGHRRALTVVLLRGELPFFGGYAMASLLDPRGIRQRDLRRFVLTQAYRLEDHTRQMVACVGRPYQYIREAHTQRRVGPPAGRAP
jgi:hypothetical protein